MTSIAGPAIEPAPRAAPDPLPTPAPTPPRRLTAIPLVAALLAGLAALFLGLPLVGLRLETVDAGSAVRFDWPALGGLALLVALVLGIESTRRRHPALGAALALLLLGTSAAVTLAPPMLGATAIAWPTVTLGWCAVAAGLVLAVRALARLPLVRQTAARLPHSPALQARLRLAAIMLLVGLAIALPVLPLAESAAKMRQIVDAGTLIVIFTIAAWGLNLVIGKAGVLALGFMAFLAIGAYTYAYLTLNAGLSFWLALPIATLTAGLLGLLLGLPALRPRGDYLAIVTLGFGEIVHTVLEAWTEVTGGGQGLSRIPRPDFFGLATFDRRAEGGLPAFHDFVGLEKWDANYRVWFIYWLALGTALLVNLLILRLRRLPLVRSWEAIREDDIAAAAVGIDRTRAKLAAFALSAAIGGLAGVFFAVRQGAISPSSFAFSESVLVLAIVVLGGSGTQLGVLVATLILVGLPEWIRDLQEYRVAVFGLGMILIMLVRPRGLFAARIPTIRPSIHPRGRPPSRPPGHASAIPAQARP